MLNRQGSQGIVAIQDIPHTYRKAKSLSFKTPISFIKLLWNFALNMTVYLPRSLQNFKQFDNWEISSGQIRFHGFEFLRDILYSTIPRMSLVLVAGSGVWSSPWRDHYSWTAGPGFSIKIIPSYQYRKSRCGAETVARTSYLPNGSSYTDKACLYWLLPRTLGLPANYYTPYCLFKLAIGSI